MATTSSSSSAKKVARLAQRGKGRKVRFQGGSLFPVAVILVIVFGLVTIVYARESRPDPGSFPPQVGDHWHAAYGIYRCDTWLPKFTDDKEETDANGQLLDDDFALTGIHTHGDGVIHYHPYSTRAVGRRARLGVFLDVYNVELTETRLAIPESEGGEVIDLDDGFECNGENTEIKVVAWDNFGDTGNRQTYITDFGDIPIRQDGMVFVIAIVPRGTDVSMPPWAADLPALGAADTGNVPQTTIEGQTITSVATTGDGTAPSTPGSDTATTVSTESSAPPASGTAATEDTASGSAPSTGPPDPAPTSSGG